MGQSFPKRNASNWRRGDLGYCSISPPGTSTALPTLQSCWTISFSNSEQPKAVLAAMIEAAAFATSDRNKEPTLLAVKSTLGLSEGSAAEKGLRELVETLRA